MIQNTCLLLLILGTLFFWLIHFYRRVFFFLYFWQLKEYRLDRFIEEVKRRKKIVFSKFFFLSLISFLAYFIFLKRLLFWEISVAFLYFLFGSYSILLFFKKKWIFPRFTKKMMLFFAFVFVAQIFLVWRFSNDFFILILVLEFLFPVFIFLCLQIIQIPVIFEKKRIIKKAKKKIQQFPDLTTIGITGSYGKTSTKEILYNFLSKDNNVLETSVHVNTEMGVAETIIHSIEKKYKFFICEMAAYKRGEVKAIAKMAKPKIGILTGINEQHLALFGSQENIIQAKYELIEALPNNGLAVFNGNNEYCLDLYKKTKKPKMLYALEKEINGISLDVWAEDIETHKDSSSFKVCYKNGEKVEFKINLLGRYSILNVLASICVAKYLGSSLKKMANISNNLPALLAGMTLKQGINSLDIIDSSYSANPTGVISALEHLKLWRSKRVIVMPSLIELGASSKRVHLEIGKKINEICDLAIITTKDEFDNIEKGALNTKILYISNPKEIIQKIKEFCSPGDVVLLEGRISKKVVKELTKK